MIAQKLADLARKANEDQSKAMKRSDKARIAEEFGEAALKLFTDPDEISIATKVEAFDKLRDMLVTELAAATRSGIQGRFRRDEDHDHYVYETAMEVCLGAGIFTGVNALSSMLGD